MLANKFALIPNLKQVLGRFSDRGNQGLSKLHLKKCVRNIDSVYMSCQATSKFNIPGITPTWTAYTWSSRGGGSTGMNNVFGFLLTFLTWDFKVTFARKPFWEHQSAENFKTVT